MQWILVFGLSAVIAAAAYLAKNVRENGLINGSRDAGRETAFWEKAEIFTANAAYETVVSEIGRMDFSEIRADVYVNLNGRKAVLWKSSYAWNARLAYMGEKEGRQVYRFEFTGWKTRNDSPYHTNTMNIMMTMVENLFLSLDPSTSVEAQKMQLKSKSKII